TERLAARTARVRQEHDDRRCGQLAAVWGLTRAGRRVPFWRSPQRSAPLLGLDGFPQRVGRCRLCGVVSSRWYWLRNPRTAWCRLGVARTVANGLSAEPGEAV